MASAPSEKDLQELLRLLTTTRKLPILQAMTQVKALQAANLRSIQQIAEAPADVVKDAIKDAAAAKSLQTSCKTALKKMAAGGSATGSKRTASASGSASAKRAKQLDGTAAASSSSNMFLGPEPMTAAELERSLELPVFVPADEEEEARIASTVLLTNRAPLVLAFAVELLRYTMPEQPVSSRLSLAQAVVSANSRSKATSLGLEWAKGPSADESGWGQGQPRVRILGREVAVLKRSGYTWKGDEEQEEVVGIDDDKEPEATQATGTDAVVASEPYQAPPQLAPQVHSALSQPAAGVWSTSQTISLKDSTFVARATTITDPAQRAGLLRSLMEAHPKLLTASHNAWAYRVRSTSSDYASSVRQDSYDDGETGCGDLMLRILHELGAVDTLVVLTRWFGGTFLGPDRWRLMRNCVTGVMAERLRRTGADVALGGEAAWGLDLEAMREQQEAGGAGAGAGTGGRSSSHSAASRFKHGPNTGLTPVVGMPIHRPEGARQYLMRSFVSSEDSGKVGGVGPTSETTPTKKKKTVKAMDAEKEENLSLLLGALRMVYDSWADHITTAELDRRAWSWYVAVRPDVDAGPSGWGAKGTVKLKDILALRRIEQKT
ncbi:hypothetical protein HMPREF1624_04253 [Sporothrix schenckii ATCC 58251]|uniref:Impact N-terminal domain-containing protein n=1 Tax=Sporothrix schenckii (strain ATCC 58251 / de Perez 2211183) TaxID=1391915 RepID=U7PTV1_SPOS1|nr:hypothetical protein HMPREF1624_04253 [Sporothrix schenckii ATCC 58251]